jgi:hypothetical protein
MKKRIFMLVCFSVIGIQASLGQLGGWFKWSNESYIPTSEDYGKIVFGINQGFVKKNTWYIFPNGEDQYMVLHPIEWRDRVLQVYAETDQTVTLQNLPEKVSDSEDTFWGEDLISVLTKNYYYSTREGKSSFVSDYSGASEKVPISVKNGKPKIKRNCGNPQGLPENSLSLITTQPQLLNINQTQEVYGEVRVVFDPLVIEHNHKHDTVFVVHINKETPPVTTVPLLPPVGDEKKPKTFLSKTLWGIGGAILAGTIVYFLLRKKGGGPSGAPTDGDGPSTEPGGPGGAPTDG